MSEKMREDFELWAVSNFSMEADVNGLYQNYLTECVWQAWQASRAALVVELPSFENGSIRGYSGDCDE